MGGFEGRQSSFHDNEVEILVSFGISRVMISVLSFRVRDVMGMGT